MSDFSLDLRDYACPLPLLMAKRALNALEAGEKITIFTHNSVSATEFEQLAVSLHLRFIIHSPHHFTFEKE